MKDIKEALGTLRELLENSPQDKLVDILKRNVQKAEKNPVRYEAVLKNQNLDEVKDNLYLLSKILNANPKDLKYYHQVYKEQISKAFTTDAAGLGAEFIPRELSTKIIELIQEYTPVSNLFQSLNMPTNPYMIPVFYDELMGYLRPESITSTPNDISAGATMTDYITLTAQTLFAWIPLSDELAEDILEPALPLIKDSIARSIARAIEHAIVNGDTDSPPIDSDLTSTSDPRRAFDGLRKYALNAGLTEALDFDLGGIRELRKLRALMGRWGKTTDNLVLIVSPIGYLHLLNTDEVLTVDRFGNEATVKTGRLPRIDGIPIVVSEWVREDLNADGRYNGTNTAYTTILLLDKTRFIIGRRGSLVVDTNEDKLYRRHDFIASMRLTFAALPTVTRDYPFVVAGVGIPNTLTSEELPPEET